MKLQIRNWTSKAGKSGTTYEIKKLDPKGFGMMVNDVIAIEAAFDVKISKNDWTDPKTKVVKTITSVNLTGKPLTKIDNYQPNEYDNGNFKLPSSVEEKAVNVRKGDIIYLRLRSFEAKDKDGKNETRYVYDFQINKEFTDDGSKQATLTPAQTVAEVAKAGIKLPGEFKDPNVWPKDVQDVINTLVANKPTFNKVFRVPANYRPESFIKWIKSSDSDVKSPLDDGQIIALYEELSKLCA